MKNRTLLVAAALAASFAWGTVARAANYCVAGPLTCVTTMPPGGFCVCQAKGDVQDGTVMAKLDKGRKVNASSGGCGSNPRDPGCR
jgi:hypothetical protein